MLETLIAISLLLAALAGIVTSCTLLWRKVVKPTWRFFRRLGKVVDVVHELPEWCLSVDEVLLELRPNHGGSIKDKVTAIQSMLEQHTSDATLHHHDHQGATVIVTNTGTMDVVQGDSS